MGLAASQAKLLSITSRLSTLELRSQQISRAKEALAMDTAKISEEYVNAMNKTALTYSTYNDDGEKVYVPLTGSELMTYSPIKNQYALVNASGQVLVSEKDAANYEDSADINEFLAKYGFDPIEESEIHTVVNPDYQLAYDDWDKKHKEWETRKPDPADPIYWIEQENAVNYDYYDKFLWSTRTCFICAIGYLARELDIPDQEFYDSQGRKVSSYEHQGDDYVFIRMFDESGSQIGGGGIDDMNRLCYCHALSHLLENGDHYTSLGDPITVSDTQYSYPFGHWWDNNNGYRRDDSDELTQLLKPDATPLAICCGEGGVDITLEDWNSAKAGDLNAKAKVLMSDYYYDSNNQPQLKSVYQKIVDLDYGMGYDIGTANMTYRSITWSEYGSEYTFSLQNAYDSILHFAYHDLKNAFIEQEDKFDQDAYDEDYQRWLDEEPEMEEIEATIEEETYSYTLPDDAQWYVNLWHRMNGDSQQKDGYTTNQFATTNTLNGLFTNQKRWDILEDGLMNSAEWLKTALETGAIIIERVDYANPSKLGSGIKKYDWVATPYKNALDIVEQTDDKAVAKAQAEYERKQRVLEDKDKQYDSVLKLIDTEHSALQTEYESAKAVVQKNTERTLKIYSA